MTKIIVKYDNLQINKDNITSKINELFQIIENINIECNSISESEIWSGKLRDTFVNKNKELYEYANNNLLNYNDLNSIKELIISEFKQTELNNSEKYVG